MTVIPANDEIANRLAQVLTPDNGMQYKDGYGSAGGRMFNLSFSIAGARTPFAFEVYARYEGKEVKLGDISSGCEVRDNEDFREMFNSTRSQRAIMTQIRDAVPPTIDLIFRPSEQVGKRTIDLKEIYGGEVLVKGVTVTQ